MGFLDKLLGRGGTKKVTDPQPERTVVNHEEQAAPGHVDPVVVNHEEQKKGSSADKI